MKDFHCACGGRVFFDNDKCLNCGRLLGFDPHALTLIALENSGNSAVWAAASPGGYGAYRCCANREQHCNWILPESDAGPYCVSCRLTQTIPNLAFAKNKVGWGKLEAAKRRLLYGLISLGLSVEDGYLQFEFLEDKATNPLVRDWHVYTGHKDGVITINVAEADDASREAIRKAMGESYRTLLGHLRHESGHYYQIHVVNTDAARAEYRQLFGDDGGDYEAALTRYYQEGPPANWAENYISRYASCHPREDWAESWAHFLHIADTLETGRCAGWLSAETGMQSGDWMSDWSDASIWLNEMNRSLGLENAYPFTLTPKTVEKLEFIRRQVGYLTAPR